MSTVHGYTPSIAADRSSTEAGRPGQGQSSNNVGLESTALSIDKVNESDDSNLKALGSRDVEIWRSAAAIALIYLLFASAWVVLTTYVISIMFADSPYRLTGQVLSGLFFAGASSLSIFVMLRRNSSLGAGQRAIDVSVHHEDMFEHHPMPMWVYDSATQKFLAVNDAAVHRYGFSRDEFSEMTLCDIRPVEDIPLLLAKHTTTSANGYGDAGIWRHKAKSGDLMHMHISLNRTLYKGRDATLVSAREVTNDVESRQALESLKNSLEERVLQRTAELQAANLELDAFARSAAHDLRTPLNGIMGFTQILQRDLTRGKREVQAESLRSIERSAKTMISLIEGLLAMSRASQKEFATEHVDLSTLAALSMEQLRNADPTQRMEFELQSGLKTIGDPALLFSLMSNLLSNAWKYSAKGEDPKIEFGAQKLVDGSRVFFVKDNGVGFPMKQVERLFKPFQRLHSARDYEGNGVGLVTCQRVILRHGGKIWPTSEVGQGTTIWFTL